MTFVEIAVVALSSVLLLAMARWVLQWMCGMPLRAVLIEHDNHAYGLAVSGYLIGVIWTVSVLLRAPGVGLWWRDILNVLAYGGMSILLLTIVGFVTSRLFLGRQVRQQLSDHNLATGVVVAGVYIATSMTYSGALVGEGGGIWTMSLFFILGQLSLLGITCLYRTLTIYDDVYEIATGNVAAAISVSGLIISVGAVVGHAAGGAYTGLWDSLLKFLVATTVVLIFYPIRQLILQCFILGERPRLRSVLLDAEVSEDENVAAGVLEATTYLSSAVLVTQLV